MESGLYWAKKKKDDDWNCIANVYGHPDFYDVKIYCVDWPNGGMMADVDMAKNPLIFGEKIIIPKADIDEDYYEWECPECGRVGTYADLRKYKQSGVDICPDCSIEVICVDE